MQLFAALYNIMFPTGNPEDMAREQQQAKELLMRNCEAWIASDMFQYERHKDAVQANQELKAQQGLRARQGRTAHSAAGAQGAGAK